jgi:regulator of PEP synthase PpsR (kinase-PPPase family)
LERRSQVLIAEQIRSLVREAAECESLIVHTLASNELWRLMLAECRTHNVDALDLPGPVLERLTIRLRLTPANSPGCFNS